MEIAYYKWVGGVFLLATLEIRHKKREMMLIVYADVMLREEVSSQMIRLNSEGRYENEILQMNRRYVQFLLTSQDSWENCWKKFITIMNVFLGRKGIEYTPR